MRFGAVEPAFNVPEQPSALDCLAAKLSSWLKTEAGKSHQQRRRSRQLHDDLVKLGYTGFYAWVAAFARVWRPDRQREHQTTGHRPFVPLVFLPGEAFQLDWSEFD